MDKVTRPGPELRERMEAFHPELTALVDTMYADFGAKLLSFRSSTGHIDVVAKRVIESQNRVAIRIWPETTPAEARDIDAQNNIKP